MVINSQRQNAGAAQVKPVALKRSLHVELVLRLSLSVSSSLSLSLSLSFGNSQIFLKWIKFYVYLFVFFFASIFPSLIIYFPCFRELCFSFLLLSLGFSNIIVVPSCKQKALWDILLPIRWRRALETNFPIGQLIAFSVQAKSWLLKLKFRLQLSVDVVCLFLLLLGTII